jgi:hypothetical protein
MKRIDWKEKEPMLFALVGKMPATKIANELEVSATAIHGYCSWRGISLKLVTEETPPINLDAIWKVPSMASRAEQ